MNKARGFIHILSTNPNINENIVHNMSPYLATSFFSEFVFILRVTSPCTTGIKALYDHNATVEV